MRIPELLTFARRRDRATRLLTYIADVTVNGHPELRDRPRPPIGARRAEVPSFSPNMAEGSKQRLDRLGPDKLIKWMHQTPDVLITDTTMRDAHQSLLATRLRTHDIAAIAGSYSRGLANLFSLECWGGATFDVAMRFLNEDPWERLAVIRARVPNILLQALIRGSSGVGYANYADNVVQFFVKQAANAGIDLFRIFDCFNWVENMRVSVDAAREAGKLAEGAICYTGDINDPLRAKYSLQYYVALARTLSGQAAISWA